MQDPAPPHEPVEPHEVLYRRVRQRYNDNPGGRISINVFKDRSMRPSVNRAKRCKRHAEATKIDAEDGVVAIVASELALISEVVQNDSKGNPKQDYVVKAVPSPIINEPDTPDNCAHVEIWTEPSKLNDTVFRKLKEALASRAQWVIPGVPLEQPE